MPDAKEFVSTVDVTAQLRLDVPTYRGSTVWSGFLGHVQVEIVNALVAEGVLDGSHSQEIDYLRNFALNAGKFIDDIPGAFTVRSKRWIWHACAGCGKRVLLAPFTHFVPSCGVAGCDGELERAAVAASVEAASVARV